MVSKKEPRVREQCGTRAGYRQHTKRGESPCGLCREANRAYERERRRKRGDSGGRRGVVKEQVREASRPSLRVVEPEAGAPDEAARDASAVAVDGEGVPRFLQAAGRRLWGELSEEFEMGPAARVLAVEACRMSDRLERFAGALSKRSTLWFELGEPEELESGDFQVQVVVNGLLAEARQTQQALGVTLKRIGALSEAKSKADASQDDLAVALAKRRAARKGQA